MDTILAESAGPYTGKLDRSDFYWLAYLIFVLIEPIERRSLLYWAESLAIIAVFVALYITFLRRGPLLRQFCLLAAMAALGLATMPFNGGCAAFVIYAAALLPFIVRSPGWLFSILPFLGAAVGVEGALLHYHPWAIFLNVFFTLFVGAMNLHFAERERANCKLRRQSEEIEALAALAERERIARDLHDVLGHTLSVIVLKSELASRLLERELEAAPDPHEPFAGSVNGSSSLPEGETSAVRRAQAEIADVERIARTALSEVREAIGGYRARGLSAEIEAARRTLATAGVTLHTQGELRPAGLSAAEETVLSLALREAVTNIVRHAQASNCYLRLLADGDHQRLSIEDDGQHPVPREGNGLRGMRERVEALGGHLSLTRDAGTQLHIDLPQRAV